MAKGGGHIGPARQAKERQRAITQRGERVRRLTDAGLPGVFAAGDIAHVVRLVLNTPMPAPERFEGRDGGLVGGQAGQRIGARGMDAPIAQALCPAAPRQSLARPETPTNPPAHRGAAAGGGWCVTRLTKWTLAPWVWAPRTALPSSATSATASLTTAPTLTLGEANFRDAATNIAKSVTSATSTIGSASYVGQLYTIVLRLHAVRSAATAGTTGDCSADSASVTVTLFIGVDP